MITITLTQKQAEKLANFLWVFCDDSSMLEGLASPALRELRALVDAAIEDAPEEHPPEAAGTCLDPDHLAYAAQEVAAERERLRAEIATLQTVWEDTRTQRDELMAHIKDGASLPEWAAKWIAVCKA